jgi:HK97 family phage major capsid protein
MTATDPLQGLDVRAVPDDRLAETKAHLLAAAGELVNRSGNLQPADADRLEQLTRSVWFLDQRSKTIEHNQALSRISGALDNGSGRPGSQFGLSGGTGGAQHRSLGEAVASSEEWRGWLDRGGIGQFAAPVNGIEFRAVGDVTLAPGSAGTMTRPDRQSRMGQDFLDRKVFLVDELPHVNVSQGSIEYVQDSTPLADLADAAREVAESGVKPQASPTFSLITEAAAVIAAWANISRQALADVNQLQSYLNGRLAYAVKRRADKEIINGTGVAPNLRGLLNRSGILTYAPGGAEARYKSIRHALRLGEDVEASYEIIVLNPADAEIFDLSNDTTAGLHATDTDGGVRDAPGRTAWGLRQVRSTAIAAGTAMLIDPMSVAVLDRQQLVAYTTDSHGSNFTSNICTLLLEARLGLALYNPTGVLKLTFNGAA